MGLLEEICILLFFVKKYNCFKILRVRVSAVTFLSHSTTFKYIGPAVLLKCANKREQHW